MACDKWTVLKILEVALCIVCIVYKRVTDDEGVRLFYFLQKLSREWPLLNSVTWDSNGSSLADITLGGYVIITTGLLIGHLTRGTGHAARVMENFFLGLGALAFVIVGALVFASLDSVPPDLVDNAAVLGVLTLVTGLLFIFDMGVGNARRKTYRIPRKPLPEKATQTDVGQIVYNATRSVDLLSPGRNEPSPASQLRSSLKQRRPDDGQRTPTSPDVTRNGHGPPVEYPAQHQRQEYREPQSPRYEEHSSEESEPENHSRVPTVSFLLSERREPNGDKLGEMKSRSHRDLSSGKDLRSLPMVPLPMPSIEDLRRARAHESSDPGKGGRNMGSVEDVDRRPMSDKFYFGHYKDKPNGYRKQESPDPDVDSLREITEEMEEIAKKERERMFLESKRQKQKVSPASVEDEKESKRSPLDVRKVSERDGIGHNDHSSSNIQLEEMKEMLKREREKELFDAHQQKSSRPPSRGGLRTPRSVSSPSPEYDDNNHWRFDSRDANLSRSSSRLEERESPSSPLDPGYVLHTAHNWPDNTPKTPGQSPPEDKGPGRSSSEEEGRTPISSPSPTEGKPSTTQQAQQKEKKIVGRRTFQNRPTSPVVIGIRPEDVDEDAPAGGSLTTQLLQKWLKQKHGKVSKMKSNP